MNDNEENIVSNGAVIPSADEHLLTLQMLFPGVVDHHKLRLLWIYATSGQGKLLRSCRMALIDNQKHYRWLQNDPEYAAAFDKADHMAADYLIEQVRKRATEGEKPSDLLLMFALKAKRPEYRDHYQVSHEHSGTVTISLEERTRKANERLMRLRQQHAQGVIDVTPTEVPLE